MIGVARAHVAHVLEGTPRVQDACIVASELTTLSVTAPGAAEFTISVELFAHHVRLEVHHCAPLPEPDTTAPLADDVALGIGLVYLIADDLGHDRTPEDSTRWAELRWPSTPVESTP